MQQKHERVVKREMLKAKGAADVAVSRIVVLLERGEKTRKLIVLRSAIARGDGRVIRIHCGNPWEPTIHVPPDHRMARLGRLEVL